MAKTDGGPVRISVENEKEWLKLRRKNVGSSEVGVLFGVSKYDTPFTLYHKKLGNLSDEIDNARMVWGRALEPGIADGICEIEGMMYRKAHEYCVHESVPGMAASLDFEIYDEDTSSWVPFEVKNVDFFIFKDEWDQEMDPPDPPLSMTLQVMQQIEVMNAPCGYLGALIGGNNHRLIRIPRMPALIDDMKSRIKTFWDDVAAGNEPDPIVPDDVPAMAKAWLEVSEGTQNADGDEQAEAYMRLYAEGAALAKQGEEMKDIAKGEILKLYPDAETLKLDGGKIGMKLLPERVQERKEVVIAARRDIRFYPSKALKAKIAEAVNEEN